jgi:hypothetical protein
MRRATAAIALGAALFLLVGCPPDPGRGPVQRPPGPLSETELQKVTEAVEAAYGDAVAAVGQVDSVDVAAGVAVVSFGGKVELQERMPVRFHISSPWGNRGSGEVLQSIDATHVGVNLSVDPTGASQKLQTGHVAVVLKK